MWPSFLTNILNEHDHLEKVIPKVKDSGRRLLPRTKWIVVGVASILTSLLVFGIMSAGKGHNSTEARADFDNPNLIGVATPPEPPLLHDAPNLSSSLTADPPTTQALNTAHIKEENGSAKDNDSKTQHETWLSHHRYQQEEQSMTNLERALIAPLAQNVNHDNNESRQVTENVLSSHTLQQPVTSPENKQAASSLNHNEEGSVLPEVLTPAPGAHEVMAGSILPALLITAINSDLPGLITAQISQNVFDTLHPNVLLIPQGSRLIGRYDHAISYGQSRVLVAWQRLLFPDGSSINLEGMAGTDQSGEAGLTDLTNNHYGRIFGSALLISFLGVGAQLSQPQNNSLLTSPGAGQQASAAAANELNMVGSQLLQKNLNIAPTLEIRAGTELNVLVNKTLLLPPYPHG